MTGDKDGRLPVGLYEQLVTNQLTTVINNHGVRAQLAPVQKPESSARPADGVRCVIDAHYDTVIVDEFHLAAANTCTRLLARVTPRELLGLTATPERGDLKDVTSWFGIRTAAELRLWGAVDYG